MNGNSIIMWASIDYRKKNKITFLPSKVIAKIYKNSLENERNNFSEMIKENFIFQWQHSYNVVSQVVKYCSKNMISENLSVLSLNFNNWKSIFSLIIQEGIIQEDLRQWAATV